MYLVIKCYKLGTLREEDFKIGTTNAIYVRPYAVASFLLSKRLENAGHNKEIFIVERDLFLPSSDKTFHNMHRLIIDEQYVYA